MRLDPYNRILKAAANGTGVSIDAAEARALAQDGAIETRAVMISEDQSQWSRQLRDAAPASRYYGPE